MNRHIVVLAASLLATAGCSTNKKPIGSANESAQRVPIGPDVRLAWHQEVIVDDTPYRIRFADVVEDSRCAPDVQCVWAGRVRIALALTLEGGTPVVDTLVLGPGSPAQPARYGNLGVRFVGYEPAPARSTEARPAQQAVALLRLERSGG